MKYMKSSRYENLDSFFIDAKTVNTVFDTAPELKIPLNRLYEKITNLHANKELCIESADNYLTSVLLRSNYSAYKMKLFTGSAVILIDEPKEQSAVRMYA